MFKKLTLIIFLFSFNAQAEIYTWVDEHGKKHFGDKVPLEYQNQTDVLELKIHQPSEEEIKKRKETNRRINESLNESQKKRQVEKQRKQEALAKKPVQKKEKDDADEKDKKSDSDY